MSRSSRITRVASAIGAGGITVLALSMPTTAFAEPPNWPAGVDVGAAKNGNVNPPRIDVRALLRDIDNPLPAYQAPIPAPITAEVLVDDNSVELLQLALGAAAGTAITVAGLVAFSARNRRRSAQPTA